jgi:hypothetical protein
MASFYMYKERYKSPKLREKTEPGTQSPGALTKELFAVFENDKCMLC